MKTKNSTPQGATLVASLPQNQSSGSFSEKQTLKSYKLLSDRELVEQYVKGNENCMAILLERHKRRIFGHIIKLVGYGPLAEDIFQETFYKVIRSLKSGLYKEDDKFLPWVLRISKNMIIDHFRRARRIRMTSTVRNSEGEHEDIFNVIDFSEKIQSTHVEKRQAHRQIRHLIKRLPDEQRAVLLMREYFDMSFNEICEMTKMNLNTALGRMRYAILNLKKMAIEANISY
jgi:RNA polymerase sigma-70 factor (ECF subfamily)